MECRCSISGENVCRHFPLGALIVAGRAIVVRVSSTDETRVRGITPYRANVVTVQDQCRTQCLHKEENTASCLLYRTRRM